MKVTVKYFNIFRQNMGRKGEEICLPAGCKLRELLNKLAAKYRDKIDNLIFNREGKIKSLLKVYINEEQVRDYDVNLNDGDEIYLFISMPGG